MKKIIPYSSRAMVVLKIGSDNASNQRMECVVQGGWDYQDIGSTYDAKSRRRGTAHILFPNCQPRIYGHSSWATAALERPDGTYWKNQKL